MPSNDQKWTDLVALLRDHINNHMDQWELWKLKDSLGNLVYIKISRYPGDGYDTRVFDDLDSPEHKEGYDDMPTAFDITAPEHVEVLVRHDRKVVWVNIDGMCRVRICQIKELTINDDSAK